MDVKNQVVNWWSVKNPRIQAWGVSDNTCILGFIFLTVIVLVIILNFNSRNNMMTGGTPIISVSGVVVEIISDTELVIEVSSHFGSRVEYDSTLHLSREKLRWDFFLGETVKVYFDEDNAMISKIELGSIVLMSYYMYINNIDFSDYPNGSLVIRSIDLSVLE